MLQTIEECALNAWPALQQLLLDGWIVRFANGYTQRANSVNPIYPGTQDADQKIQRCIQLYRTRNLRPIFRITPLAQPSNLDAMLDDLGFTVKSITSVQILNLESLIAPQTDACQLSPEFSTEWLALFSRLKGNPKQNKLHQAILQNIMPETCFATLIHQNEVVACGLAVAEGAYVGLFDIITHPHHRRKGFGQTIILNLLHWGKNHGATQAYLQVEKENVPALNLYAGLGFAEIYQYWYRMSA